MFIMLGRDRNRPAATEPYHQPMTRRSLPAPKDLGVPGVALWRRLTKEFDFNSAEIELAHQLCVTVDEETMMRDELADMGVTVAGSKGQPVLNPVFAQLAVHRKLIDQMIVALSLPIDGESVGRRRSAQAKLNADSRWRNPTDEGQGSR
jgi:hypothetical protein